MAEAVHDPAEYLDCPRDRPSHRDRQNARRRSSGLLLDSAREVQERLEL